MNIKYFEGVTLRSLRFFKNGKVHRIDKPAKILKTKLPGANQHIEFFYLNQGLLHNIKGPAFVCDKCVNHAQYYVDNIAYSKAIWKILIEKLND